METDTAIIAKTIDKGFGILEKALAKYEEHKNLALQNEALLRTYYLEVITNIDLIDAVSPNVTNTVEITNETFQTFANTLQTNAAIQILFSQETQNGKAFKTLIKKTKQYTLADETGTETQYPRNTNLLTAMLFTISKIEFLKAIPSHNFNELLHPFRLQTRLKNIKTSLMAIKKIMEETTLKK